MTLCVTCASVDYRWCVVCFFLRNFHEPRGRLTYLDWPSLAASGSYLVPIGLFCCPVSTANCHSASPFANCLLWVPSSNCWLAFPYLLRVASRSWARAFVSFRAKTDKGIVCLADHPHSVTIRHKSFDIIENSLKSPQNQLFLLYVFLSNSKHAVDSINISDDDSFNTLNFHGYTKIIWYKYLILNEQL